MRLKGKISRLCHPTPAEVPAESTSEIIASHVRWHELSMCAKHVFRYPGPKQGQDRTPLPGLPRATGPHGSLSVTKHFSLELSLMIFGGLHVHCSCLEPKGLLSPVSQVWWLQPGSKKQEPALPPLPETGPIPESWPQPLLSSSCSSQGPQLPGL